MRATPTSVMTLSIIGIVLGVISLVGGCGNVGLFVIDPAPFIKVLPQMQVYLTDPVIRAFTLSQGIVNIAINSLLITACIASFSLRPWARRTMLGVAWTKIALAIIAQVIQFILVTPKLIAFYPPGSPERAGAELGRYLAPVVLLLVIAYPICVIYFYRRRVVVDAFRGILPQTHQFPVEFGGDVPPPATPETPRPASPLDDQFP